MANTMTIEQATVVANAIVAAAQGRTFDRDNLVDVTTIGQKALLVGEDPLLRGISQVLTKTLFAIRPYYRKFPSLAATNDSYGNMVRKVNYCDTDVKDAERFDLPDGMSKPAAKSMYEIAKTPVYQENFYGAETYDRSTTVYRDQMNSAFTGLSQFNEFISGVMQNAQDQIEQTHETFARDLICLAIDGAVSATANDYCDKVVHLITEYNNKTGESLTPATVYAPDNYKKFIQFAYALIASVSSMMTERTNLYQTNIDGKRIMRHTPYDKQRMYILAPERYAMEARVLADTYHDNYLKFADVETVNFWQDAAHPDTIFNKNVAMIKPDGTIDTRGGMGDMMPKVFAFLHDKDALGYNVVSEWSAPSPFEARLGYTNIWWHFTDRYWRSDLEKGVVFTLD